MVLTGLSPSTQGDQALIGVGFDAHVTANASEAFDEDAEYLRVNVARSSLYNCRKVTQPLGFDGVGQRMQAREALAVVGDEEVVVVEYEDVDSLLAAHDRHLCGDSGRLTQPIAFSRQRLFMPGGDAAKRAIGVAAATGNQGRDPMIETARWLATDRPRKPGKVRDLRHRRELCPAILAARDDAGNIAPRAVVAEATTEGDEGRFCFLTADGVELRKIPQQILRCEGSEVSPDCDVPSVPRLP